MTTQLQFNNFIMGDDMFLGFFDADGCVLIIIDTHIVNDQPPNPGNAPFGLRISYEVNQSLALVELVYDMSEKGTREHTKAQYISWGVEWLENNNYI